MRNLRAENERNFRYQREKLAQIEKEIKNAEQKCKTQVQKELAKQKVELENAMKAKEAEALSGINQFLEFLKQYEEIYKKNDAEGFASVAGYDETKNKLATIFGAPLVQNKTNPNVKVPNVIALYGPKGTGKTILGESLAKQFDCEYGRSLLLKMGDDINFERLMPLAEKAKSVFEKTGRRTIIQIDEVEFFGTKQTPSFWKKLRGKPQTFEEFLSCCSEKYGCTMVVTTNEPNKIDESIRTKMKFLYVPVATKKDMAEILKFHVNNRNKEPINYNKLVNLLSEKMTDGTAFTNARLADIVYTVITTISSQKAYNQLIDIAERAKNNFNTNKNHTFILIDEFDAFAPKESEKSKQMKNLTDKIAMQYHCSILATTNFPENIDKTLLRDGKFQKMAIPPATSADIKNIIKYYLNGVFIESTELNNILNTIMGNENGSFSNSQIKNIIINCIKKSLLSNTKLESKHILQAFKENIPVITNNSLELFKKQISIVTKI